MKTKNQKNIIKRLVVWAGAIGVILLVPLLSNAPWTASDFVFAGIVLFIFASIYEIVTKNMKQTWQHIVVGAGILVGIVLVMGWAATGP